MSSVNMDFEQAGELKIGQVGIATLRIRTLNVSRLIQEMCDRVTRAPKLFKRTAVILDFGELAKTPDLVTAQALVEGLRGVNVLPVAIAYGTSEIDLLSQQLGLPLLSKFRAHYERQETVAAPPPSTPPTPPPAKASRIQHTTVRSGQQLYAEHCDLTILNTVGAGAEVIADGSIHIYGTLRGRAMAGARGNTEMRIFCRDFQAELIAIAGQYKVLDDIPTELRGKAVQVWLEQDQIKIAVLD
ncbi:septum site-determining protein MinC [Xylella taiwanensis]|uniref:Probable septum site-determining protein MinC n=1 Tax=Xylella taiwanensis TaxID=1444770 RepID=Z9JLP5_9GAMM|nr:septum site-determining protein MinC [Xylella taiwanensis]AXI83106.1 septum formation inhibitor [Xylella taiwanensis]EWS78751.1 septation inhibitor protein [Xylella taiwanensis]MCD8456148.1 septum site-determining protein MinC [Xylella taiwanensis]MCD8458554.1 septum site-determining protein MinC [Xylella taiwanensis]MCD8460689.1 septum site-determining protein MinC [Xylella taiwanensis]